jgi:hypothetical protein
LAFGIRLCKYRRVFTRTLLIFASVFAACIAFAQDNYEIQVYGSDTVKKGTTMFELHSNYTFNGPTMPINGVLPTNHALHETLEITHGFTDTFETGFYIFTSYQNDQGYNYVGSHIRPRWRVPESWKWPFGASMSVEFGFQKRQYSEDTCDLELRPIIDKQMGHWYVALNPALERGITGFNAGSGFTFSPNVKVSYDITRAVTFGFEYYGSVGPISEWDTAPNQTHQIFPAIDLNLGEEWEFNIGVGLGLNAGSAESQGTIVKMIIGRRFKF